jgi:hypothetical protein
MKYIRAKPNNNHIRIVVGEMINIMRGNTYYIDGVLQSKPKKCNTYLIKSVEYTIYPNMGVVYLTDPHISINTNDIQIMISNMLTEAKINDSNLISLSGTTRYINIQLERPKEHNISIYVDYPITKTFKDNSDNIGFRWFIYSTLDHCYSPMYIPHVTDINSYSYLGEIKNDLIALSLSSLIYDTSNLFTFTTDVLMCDYPLINHYRTSTMICVDEIYLNLLMGIDIEIARNFINVNIKNQFQLTITNDIFWLLWDPITFKRINSSIPLEKLILDIDCSILPQYNSVDDYTCALTNIPIYDECYVIDIYQQEIIEEIFTHELDKAIESGAKIYNDSVSKINSKVSSTLLVNKIKITRTINYNTPIRFLVSGYAMHINTRNKLNIVDWFQKKTKTKIILNRTKSPRTVIDVIDSLDKSDMYKNILKSLINSKITRNLKIVSKYKDITYNGSSKLYLNNVLLASSNEVYFRYKFID